MKTVLREQHEKKEELVTLQLNSVSGNFHSQNEIEAHKYTCFHLSALTQQIDSVLWQFLAIPPCSFRISLELFWYVCKQRDNNEQLPKKIDQNTHSIILKISTAQNKTNDDHKRINYNHGKFPISEKNETEFHSSQQFSFCFAVQNIKRIRYNKSAANPTRKLLRCEMYFQNGLFSIFACVYTNNYSVWFYLTIAIFESQKSRYFF